MIFSFRVFHALTSHQQRIDCLNCIKSHLNPDGRVVINLFDPAPDLLATFDQVRNRDYTYFDHDLQMHVTRFTHGIAHDAQHQTIQLKYIFELQSSKGDFSQMEDEMCLGYL